MHPNTMKMLDAVNAFQPAPGYDYAVGDLYEITEGFDDLPDKAELLPAMFALIERCVDVDLGAPGPLVHCIESLGYDDYLQQLIDSLNRQPKLATVSMAHRILNARLFQKPNAPDENQARELLTALRKVASNPAADDDLKELANEYLERHGGE